MITLLFGFWTFFLRSVALAPKAHESSHFIYSALEAPSSREGKWNIKQRIQYNLKQRCCQFLWSSRDLKWYIYIRFLGCSLKLNLPSRLHWNTLFTPTYFGPTSICLCLFETAGCYFYIRVVTEYCHYRSCDLIALFICRPSFTPGWDWPRWLPLMDYRRRSNLHWVTTNMPGQDCVSIWNPTWKDDESKIVGKLILTVET